MDFCISGLPAEEFSELFAMSDDELAASGARRMRAEPGGAPMPCRVTLSEAGPGDVSILLHYAHHVAPRSPYRASGPIFVRQDAQRTARFFNEVPAPMRSRLLSVRAYDAEGFLVEADARTGDALEELIARCFARPEVAYLHVHNARPGCYHCRVDRV